MKPTDQEARRLTDAADAVLVVAVEMARVMGAPISYPGDWRREGYDPGPLKGYSDEEITQASDMLVRLGVLEDVEGGST